MSPIILDGITPTTIYVGREAYDHIQRILTDYAKDFVRPTTTFSGATASYRTQPWLRKKIRVTDSKSALSNKKILAGILTDRYCWKTIRWLSEPCGQVPDTTAGPVVNKQLSPHRAREPP